MGQDVNVFLGDDAATVNIAAGTTSANVQLRAAATGEQYDDDEVRVANPSDTVIFIRFGATGVTAAVATGIPILPNTVEAFRIRSSNTHVAAITASGTSKTIYFTPGQGL